MAFTAGMFCVAYSERFSVKSRQKLAALGIFLIFLVWMATPLSPTRRINYEGYHELPVVLFIAFCLLSGVVLLIVTNVKERKPHKKHDRTMISVLIVPLLLWISASYIFYLFDINVFQYNYIFAICFTVLFLLLGAKQGVLGVKIKMEMLKADATSVNADFILTHHRRFKFDPPGDFFMD